MKVRRTYNGIFDVARPYTTSRGSIASMISSTPNVSKLIDTIGHTKIPVLSDAEGLRKAYELPNKVYVDNNTNKMYIAGTSNWQDVWDDFKIPFHLTSDSQRYEQAEQALKDNPQIKTVVGHSLGSAVSLELEKNHPGKFKTISYGGPVFQLGNEKGERYRHPGDVISIFDKGAVNVDSFNWLNPLAAHSYEGYNGQGADDIGNYGNSFSYSKKKF